VLTLCEPHFLPFPVHTANQPVQLHTSLQQEKSFLSDNRHSSLAYDPQKGEQGVFSSLLFYSFWLFYMARLIQPMPN
jgi:hypothetical protein